MLANTLTTNEIKDRTGAEQEFTRISQGDRETVFALSSETPSAPHRLSVKHVEIGSGVDKRRRSLIRFDKTVAGQVNAAQPATVSCYMVADIPVGNLTAYTTVTDLVANLISFAASLGASTTILYDGTGNGASTLINGSL
jgi:hypothetical protein